MPEKISGKRGAMEEKKRSKRKESNNSGDQGKSLYEKVITGEVEPEGSQKGWANLQPDKYNFAVLNEKDPERAKEISRKGAETVNKLHGEKKTAKQCLEKILTLKVNDKIIDGADLDSDIAERLKRSNPDATLYDLIQIVAAGRAVGGNIKAAEYIRDTYGDKPTEKIDVTGEIMTETDRAMLEKIARRLDDPGLIIAKDAT